VTLAALSASACGSSRTAGSSAARILFVSDRTGAWALYSMHADGSGQQRVLNRLGHIDAGAEGIGIGSPRLSPDGRQLLLPRKGITAVDLETGARREIPKADASTGLWSPDSRKVAYEDNDRNYNSTGVYVTVSWSPDGRWLVINRQIGYGPNRLWLVHPNGNELQEMPGGIGAGFAWTVGGEFLDLGSRYLAIDPKTGHVDVRRQHLGVVSGASWSPDGRTVVFTAAKNQSTPPEIYAMATSGGKPRPLTKGAAEYYGSPVWSPDGKRLVFAGYGKRGLDRNTPQIWTMRADGSHARELTKPFPDGGENIDPIWIAPTTHTAAAPRVHVAARSLRIPYYVDSIAADGARAAVAPFGRDMATGASPTPPILVWSPGTRPEQLVGSLCGTISTPLFRGQTLAVECNHDFLDEHYQSVLVFDLRTRLAVEPVFAYNAFFGEGTQSGTILNGPVLGGAGVEIESSTWSAPGKKFGGSVLRRQTLSLLDGPERTTLRSAHRLGTLIAGDSSGLVIENADGSFALTTPSGAVIHTFRLPSIRVSARTPAPGFLMTGFELVRLGGGRLEAWDVRYGKVLIDRRVPAKAELQAVDSELVVYTAGADIHLLSSAGDDVIHTPAKTSYWLHYYGEPPVHAALSPAGLFYDYDLKGGTFPGRVVFVPRSALPH
jgi:WD40 repeat protein